MPKYKKKALITGIAGQDGSYLAELLVKKNYKVFGLVRSFKKDSLLNIEKLYKNKKIILIKGDLSNLKSIKKVIGIAKPDEIYNFAAQSDDVVSFKISKETYNVNFFGFGYLVDEAVKVNSKVKIFQAGSSKIFDKRKVFQNEETLFNPTSPYGKAKFKAHNKYVIGYRGKYDLFICSGIFFNHISPRCRESFVASIITKSMVKIKLGLLDNFELGNIDAKRDWGYAPEYMEAAWKMLQQKTPQDFVIATGETHSV
ncbi:MAG: GDP-mannose 4,6-dehydratase, partial [Candidatus Paceibacterota bacterium]